MAAQERNTRLRGTRSTAHTAACYPRAENLRSFNHMAAPYTDTPSYAAVRAAADQALVDPNGVTVNFTVARHGSLENCQHLARGFQVSFASMRARERKLSGAQLSEHKHSIISYAEGRYDKLVCQRSILPGGLGWTVGLYPTALMLAQLDIVSNSTGEAIQNVGVGQSPYDKAYEAVIRTCFMKPPRPPSWADWQAFREVATDAQVEEFKQDFPGMAPADPADDLATVDLDEMAFGGDEDSDPGA